MLLSCLIPQTLGFVGKHPRGVSGLNLVAFLISFEYMSFHVPDAVTAEGMGHRAA